MRNVISGISLLVALAFIASMAVDIVRTIICIFQKKQYEWTTPKLFLEAKSGWSALLIAVAVAFGLYSMAADYRESLSSKFESERDLFFEEQTRDLVMCGYCGEEFPEKYRFESYEGGTLCPLCARNDLNALLNGEIMKCVNCGSFYFPSDSNGFGLCWDCCNKYITDCNNCGEYTYAWESDTGFTLCPRCMGKMYDDDRVSDAIESWFEG